MKTGFYNDNANRCYPFLTNDELSDAVKAAVVDFGCVMGPGTGFTYSHKVRLKEINVDTVESEVTFVFGSDAPFLVYPTEKTLTFTVGFNESYISLDTETDDATSTSGDSECPDVPLWSGFLVIGDLSPLIALADGNPLQLAFTNEAIVEPARIQNLGNNAVSTINLANVNRTRAESADGCDEIDWPQMSENTVFQNATCLTGDIRFKPGFNCDVRQNAGENSIVLSAQVGAGAGEVCEEVKLYPTEAPPDGSALLTGGFTCDDVLRSFNGAGSRLFSIRAGQGVRIVPYPQSNRLLIDIDLNQMSICAEVSEIFESCSDDYSET